MDWISAHWVEIAAVVGGVVTVASVIVKMTPSVADDAVLDQDEVSDGDDLFPAYKRRHHRGGH